MTDSDDATRQLPQQDGPRHGSSAYDAGQRAVASNPEAQSPTQRLDQHREQPTFPQTSAPPQGHPQHGFAQQVRPQQSFPHQPYPQGGAQRPYGAQQGYPQHGYPQQPSPQHGYAQQGYPQQGYPQLGYLQAPRPAGPRRPSFFAALFDLSFRSSVTLSFAKVVYLGAIVLIALAWFGALISAFEWAGYGYDGGSSIGLVLVVGLPLAILAIAAVRVLLEVALAAVRTAENTEILARGRSGADHTDTDDDADRI